MGAHEPLLANLLGYATGTLVFAIFLVLLLRDREGQKLRSSRRTLAATALALIWNAGSLSLLAFESQVLLVLTTSALSLLPALLLDLLLEDRLRPLAACGYLLSVAAMAAHACEQWVDVAALHSTTLTATALGFAVLTLASGVALHRTLPDSRRAVGAMALLLFALSFTHIHGEGSEHAWLAELAIHHAGIPLALFVLLQDFRFLLLDAFLRFLANVLLAVLFTWGAAETAHRLGWVNYSQLPARQIAWMAVLTTLALLAFALVRSAAQHLLTRTLFHRGDAGALLDRLRRAPLESEERYSDWAWNETATFMQAERAAHGLGRRAGGRPYLSEDLALEAQVRALVEQRLEQFRASERKRLLSQAELRALQAQIHPHFLFNALNTLYGIIPREAAGARRTVLNLADIFRYFLRTDQQLIPLAEELQVVAAYLEIEALRLGPKLQVEMSVDEAAGAHRIPVLSIQPLVENAVRHGIAPLPAGGRVRVQARLSGAALHVDVSDSGGGFTAQGGSGAGVGLENVRQRLRLTYGPACTLEIGRQDGETRVGFTIPVPA